MPRPLKRAHIALTDENWRQLEQMMKYFGENRSEVMKRALTILYADNKYFMEMKKS